MKHFFSVCILLISLISQAGQPSSDKVSMIFDNVGIIELAKIAYGQLAKEQLVITDDALKATETASLTLRNIDKSEAVIQIAQLLRGAGYSATHKGGVIWIAKTLPGQEEDFFYKPKNRAVSYLTDMLTPLFKQGSFTLQRGLSNPQQGIQAPTLQNANSPPIIDSGTSAYSLMDKNPDAFMFKGTQREIDRLTKLLDQIDTPTPEVLVKAIVFEVSTDQKDGSALSLAAQLLAGKLSLTVGKALNGDYSAVFNGSSLQAAFNILASDSRFKVVSSPTLRVKSGSSARLTVGNETPVLGAVSYDQNGRATQSIDYKASGVIFDIKPQIREDSAELQINQQISNFIATTTGVNNSPTLIKRELSTSVGVKDSEILVLGGMDQDQITEDKKGAGWLPSFLYQNTTQKSHSEILLLLQATRI